MAGIAAAGLGLICSERLSDLSWRVYIVGFDALSGQRLWRFDTLARPGQPGGDSSMDERTCECVEHRSRGVQV